MHFVVLLLAGLLPGLSDAAAPHVRPDAAELRAMISDAQDQSTTFRALVDRIERSDLIVYVRARHFSTSRLEGRIGFVHGATGGQGPRMLLIELACPRTVAAQTVTLAHELHHATEIADAPWVRDTETLGAYYQQIGEEGLALGEGIAFETLAARGTAARVGREISDFRLQASDLRRGR